MTQQPSAQLANRRRNRLLFVGLTCLDIVYVCRHFPVEDSDQRALDSQWRRGGNASNNCTVFRQLLHWWSSNNRSAAAAAAADTTDYEIEFMGTIGGDHASRFLVDDLLANGILIDNIVRHPDRQCPSSTVIINQSNGSRTIVHFNRNLPDLDGQSMANHITESLDRYLHIHFEGLRNVPNIRQMIAQIRDRDVNHEITVSVELEKVYKPLTELLDNAEDFGKYIDIYFVEKEFAGEILDYTDADQTAVGIASRLHPGALVVCPWGESGAVAYDNRIGQLYRSPVYPPKSGSVVDTLGAGDTFLSGTLFGLLVVGLSVEDAIKMGCQVAGAKCGQWYHKEMSSQGIPKEQGI
ncbi:ketohexokinase-like [Oppia nitens]|uniref:ketohexokinase-like n=1 Tax=Oppia nitens TaxID=1686743 RepID=UPI0023DAD6BC|nr:ketohexokinase-like [Oppia nitens]